MCQAFDGAISYIAGDDESDPLFGVTCTPIKVAGPVTAENVSALGRLLRTFAESGIP